MKRLWIIGAGGHAKVVIDTAQAMGEFEVAGVLDDDVQRIGHHVMGIEILGPISRESIEAFGIELAVIAIGSNRVRAAIAERFSGAVTWTTLVHPRAYVAGHTHIGVGSVIFAGAIIQPGSMVGAHVILNTHSSVDHDCVLGDFAHIGPGAHLAGTVVLGAGVFVGLGGGVIPGQTIGEWATVGASSVVINNVEPGTTVVGIPARPVNR